MRVLVTGGAGYIGSHTCLELLATGAVVTVLDNLSNSTLEGLRRVEQLAGRSLSFVRGDLRDAKLIGNVIREGRFDAVIHFAGLKAVGESVAAPLNYYDNNVAGTLTLLNAMRSAAVHRLVFSSSATVYGDPKVLPIGEGAELSATNPYGRSKLMVEEILADLQAAEPAWQIARLRYFNPVGAHASGIIGEDPQGIPNNLMPFISQVACGRRQKLSVFGGDYPTVDGTGVRDYIHVVDLAKGHLAALKYLQSLHQGEVVTVNLGTGRGASVLEVIRAFEEASGHRIPYEIVARRPGDVAACYADPSRAERLFNWRAERTLTEMCRDTWSWQSANPLGYPAVDADVEASSS